DGAGRLLLQGRCSYGVGGMSETWGSQLFRYTARDLASVGGWPLDAEALQPYYADLEDHIGISGVHDDMEAFLGPVSALLPPVPLVPAAERLLKSYARAKASGRKPGLVLGRSRLAVLTREHEGRPPHEFGETEFFTTSQPGLYTAQRTLEELRRRGRHTYLAGHRLESWKELPEHVEVCVVNERDGTRRSLRARHLLLACGVIHTARLLLRQQGERGRRLPFLDHPPSLVPFFLPAMFGTALPARSFPVQLVATLDADTRDMISLYYPGGMLWSDFLPDMPLPFSASARILRPLLAGMLVAQLWEPSLPSPGNFLTLDEKGEVRISYADCKEYPRLGQLLRAFRRLGAYSLSRLASKSPPGWGFHYAATLPMQTDPQNYETHTDGRLWDSRRVRVIDGSVLPSLPAKNHSFTIMANAARVADEVQKCGY
ncbi:MAG: hypothetical protein K2N07_08995, partial [Desulfovibrio sp.]|nr:hypothetical protein [Desulfovibrio sp.]